MGSMARVWLEIARLIHDEGYGPYICHLARSLWYEGRITDSEYRAVLDAVKVEGNRQGCDYMTGLWKSYNPHSQKGHVVRIQFCTEQIKAARAEETGKGDSQ